MKWKKFTECSGLIGRDSATAVPYRINEGLENPVVVQFVKLHHYRKSRYSLALFMGSS
jgi:hypothetical protein